MFKVIFKKVGIEIAGYIINYYIYKGLKKKIQFCK